MNPPYRPAEAASRAHRQPFVERMFTRLATSAAHVAGQPFAFAAVAALILLWILSGPIFDWSDSWQLIVNTGTTIVTFLMVFLIQNSQNRDAAALQAKLDEVIRSISDARNEFIGIEHLTDSEIEAIRADLENEAEISGTGHRRLQSVRRLLRRR